MAMIEATRPLDEARRPDVIALLARAFHGDPAFVWAFPRDAKRARSLSALFRGLLSLYRKSGVCLVRTDEAGTVLGAAIWRPPELTVGYLSYARHGLLRMPFEVGLGATRRLLVLDAAMDRMRREHAPPRRWYLDTLGVGPEAQGRGVGSALVREALRDVVDGTGLPATLFTTNPVNVPFYQRCGFEEVARRHMGGEPGFELVYMMRRA